MLKCFKMYCQDMRFCLNRKFCLNYHAINLLKTEILSSKSSEYCNRTIFVE